MEFRFAKTNNEFEQGKELFLEYATSLNIDLSFQNFAKEIETISEQYNEPRGALIIVYENENPVGCVGIRELEKSIAELKRMYIKSEFRGKKIGNRLMEMSLKKAFDLGYCKIRLDTLPEMKNAQTLYKKYGFYEIDAYRYNPVEGTVFMEIEITN